MIRPLLLVAALGGLACVPCLGLSSSAAVSPALAATAGTAEPVAVRTAHFEIGTPFCSGCVDALVETAEAVSGVREAAVDLEALSFAVTFDDARTSPAAVRAHVERETRFRLTLTRVTSA